MLNIDANFDTHCQVKKKTVIRFGSELYKPYFKGHLMDKLFLFFILFFYFIRVKARLANVGSNWL